MNSADLFGREASLLRTWFRYPQTVLWSWVSLWERIFDGAFLADLKIALILLFEILSGKCNQQRPYSRVHPAHLDHLMLLVVCLRSDALDCGPRLFLFDSRN